MFEGVTHRGHVISGMVWNKIYRSADLLDSKVRFDETLELAEDHLWIAQVVASKAMSEYSAAVRNQALNQIRGKYFIFVDGDDQLAPSFVETLVGALEEKPDVSIASVGFSWGASGAPKKAHEVKFPVAVLSHNLEGYIGHSLKTVNKQTYKNMDIVILDDASSDDTMSEINHWAARDDRMRVIKNNKRKGV
ncbi:glycosyltransferase family 2 protein [Weissella confusa]|uniref:Glycosyltransferase family 2 protein n=1 Tax=Weissella confusa TaxID=1583 RepID=A0A923NF37_WEICO|nr:glycosyltransferase family 2 protein [Weissella confusa]